MPMIDMVSVYGASNGYAWKFIELLNATGKLSNVFDRGLAGKTVRGIKIKEPADNADLANQYHVICTFRREVTQEIRQTLESSGLEAPYLEEYLASNNFHREIVHFPDFSRIPEYSVNLSTNFPDKLSHQTLIAISKYWESGKRELLSGVAQPLSNIYFDPDIIPKKENHSYVDVGAYTGDSFFEFKKYFRNYVKAFLFEPVNEISGIDDPNVEIFTMALGKEEGSLIFSDAGINSRTDSEGQYNVNVKTLDKMNLPCSFLKIDAEGMDIDVLVGGQKLLKVQKPIVALSVYHSPEHLKIGIEKLKNFGYSDFRLRKYSCDNFETILYAIG